MLASPPVEAAPLVDVSSIVVVVSSLVVATPVEPVMVASPVVTPPFVALVLVDEPSGLPVPEDTSAVAPPESPGGDPP